MKYEVTRRKFNADKIRTQVCSSPTFYNTYYYNDTATVIVTGTAASACGGRAVFQPQRNHVSSSTQHVLKH
jgi:hypothetical protein